MDIRCRRLDCKFNDRYTCKAKSLDISKNAVCKMYQKDASKPPVEKGVSIFERTPQFASQRDSKTMTIRCQANCLLNHDGVCVANGRTVNDYRGRAYCQTFIKK